MAGRGEGPIFERDKERGGDNKEMPVGYTDMNFLFKFFKGIISFIKARKFVFTKKTEKLWKVQTRNECLTTTHSISTRVFGIYGVKLIPLSAL